MNNEVDYNSLESVVAKMRTLESRADFDGLAAFELGMLHLSPDIVAPEVRAQIPYNEQMAGSLFQKAFELLQQEANSGNAVSMHMLGMFYSSGFGGVTDMNLAHEWTRKAYDAGNIFSGNQLYDEYRDKNSPNYNPEIAEEIYRKLEIANEAVVRRKP